MKGAYLKLVSNQISATGTQGAIPGQIFQANLGDKSPSEEEQRSDNQGENGILLEKIKLNKPIDTIEDETFPETNPKSNKGIFAKLQQYLKTRHKVAVWIGSLFSLINGGLLPIFSIFLADMIDVFSKFDVLKNGTA